MKDTNAKVVKNEGLETIWAAVIQVCGDWSCCEVCRKVWGKKFNPCPSPKPAKNDERVSLTCSQVFGYWKDTDDIINIPKKCLKGWLLDEQYNLLVNGTKPVTNEVESSFNIDLLKNWR